MGRRTGSADLPLHRGRVPRWLADRMSEIGRVLVEAIVLEYGRAELLRRLAHPFWFQSLGCVMGMDWHSSGITTSVMGALKRGLEPVEVELGIHVCGGRGRHSRKTPEELQGHAGRLGLDGGSLVRASRLVAKVDSAAVQDGFQLYHHNFVVTDDGAWTVIQQGMDTDRRRARRYHWLSEGLESFVDSPHAAVDGEPRGAIVNVADRGARRSRHVQLELLRQGPDPVIDEFAGIGWPEDDDAGPPSGSPRQPRLPRLEMPRRHEVRRSDVRLHRLHAALAAAAEQGPADFPDLLLTPGVGARTVEALALVAEVVHGAPCRFSDPARFSMAHGGKDGHPYPVPLKVYDRTVSVLRRAVEAARLGRDHRLAALRRLDRQARALERAVEAKPDPGLDEIVAFERLAADLYGGRSVVAADRPDPRDRRRPTLTPARSRDPGRCGSPRRRSGSGPARASRSRSDGGRPGSS